jgi:D-glycero-D-manno-heptose 1,7-bisphosphate phosphatase
MKRAVFIERDTLLNLATTQGGQQKSPVLLEEFRLNESARPALDRLKAADFTLVATTNQPEISRGNLSRRDLDRMHEILRAAFPLDDILVCPHEEEDDCPCRKPRAGLFYEARFKWHVAFGQSFVISHRWQDAEAARLIGSTSMLIDSPWLGRGHHDLVVRDLDTAVDKILVHHLHRQVA